MAGNVHTQDGHDAQRTNTSPLDYIDPLTLGCFINGPDTNGVSAGHTWQAPTEAHTVCDSTRIFTPKGSGGVAAYNLNATGSNPAAVWTYSPATISCVCTPAVDLNTNSLWTCWSDGTLRKLNPATGALVGTYTAGGGSLRHTPLIVDNWVFVVGFDGKLHCVSTAGSGTLAATWVYTPTLVAVTNPISGMGRGSTPASWSRSRDVVVFASDDLYVHAVDRATGLLRWRVKPTTQTAGGLHDTSRWFGGNTFERGWVSIADRHGFAILRLQIEGLQYMQNAATGYPHSMAHPTIAAQKSFLAANPLYQSFFVMSLDDGSAPSWTPPVMFTYEEQSADTVALQIALTPHPPVIRVYPNGDEVVYTTFRAGCRLSTVGTNVSISASGTTATATVNNSLSTNYTIEVTGASVAGYNGVYAVTGATATTVTFTVGTSGLAPATGATIYVWPQDWRWDGHLGEMVLDSNTVAGASAGDIRYLQFERQAQSQAPGYTGGVGYSYVNDESSPIFMAGNTIIRTHWGAMEPSALTDRTSAHGFSYADPCPMTKRPVICFNQATDGAANVATHATNSGLNLGPTWFSSGGNDNHFWDGPGYFTYIEATPPPAAPALSQSAGGSWTAQTAWVVLSYVNSLGEVVGSYSYPTPASLSMTAGNQLTIPSPAASGSGALAATGWYAYVAVGATLPAGTAFHRQQAAGSPTPIGTALTVAGNPTTTGANPDTISNLVAMPGGDSGPESYVWPNYGARSRYTYTTLSGGVVYLVVQGDAGEIGIWKPATTAPTATTLSAPTVPASVARRTPFDISFTVTTPATEVQLPYDPAPPAGVDPGTGISVDVQLLAPTQTEWSQALVHACLFESTVTFTKNTYTDPYGATRTWYVVNAPAWAGHVPGLPTAGTWTVRLRAIDANGETYSATSTLTVT